MTVRARPKPKAHAETARVLRIYDWLHDELERRHPKIEGSAVIVLDGLIPGVLAVAERIAARTED